MTDAKSLQKNLASGKSGVNEKGEFVKKPSTFRSFVTADGSSGFKAEKGRYHLYVSLVCPYAHRALITRKIKGLEDVIPITVVDWFKTSDSGWMFTDKKPKCTLDTVNKCTHLKDIYKMADPKFEGNVTVPVLWDKQKKTIVNNESAEIMLMFNSAFNEFCPTPQQKAINFDPTDKKKQIEELNDWVYSGINVGVYKVGFCQSQDAYDTAIKVLFDSLDRVEAILAKSRFLTGNKITQADIRLFTSSLRFDMVYYNHFKCNKKRIAEFTHIWAWLRDMYQTLKVDGTYDRDHIKGCYEHCQKHVNPFGIISIGPDTGYNYNEPHGREKLSKASPL